MSNFLVQDKMINRGWTIEDSGLNMITAEKQHSENVIGVFEWDSNYATYTAFNVENPSEPLAFFMKPKPNDPADLEAERLFMKAESELASTSLIENNNLLAKILQSVSG